METPIFSHLMDYINDSRITFAMPGHKRGRGIRSELLSCDVTELPKTLDLRDTDGVVGKANKLLSERYGSDMSYIVTCGSTACIQSMLATALNKGDTLLAASDCHMSVINTCALCGFNIRFVPKTVNNDFLIPDRINDIESILNKYDDIKAVIVTSPNYYGICEDIKSLAKICHEKGIAILVDEAHGAHFPASEELPQSAVVLGADLVCQSAHKTLNALTGAAYVHVNGNIVDRERLREALSMFQTSSPSYVIAASADIARDELTDGSWDGICLICNEFKKKISQNTDIRVLDNDDTTRLVLNFSEYDLTGIQVEKLLSDKYKIDIEMSDEKNVVLIVTAYNTQKDMDILYAALSEITSRSEKSVSHLTIPDPPVCSTLIKPYRAFWGTKKNIEFSKSCGFISANTVCAYPPGIPIIAAGERIEKEKIDYVLNLKNTGAKITGIENGYIKITEEGNG